MIDRQKFQYFLRNDRLSTAGGSRYEHDLRRRQFRENLLLYAQARQMEVLAKFGIDLAEDHCGVRLECSKHFLVAYTDKGVPELELLRKIRPAHAAPILHGVGRQN